MSTRYSNREGMWTPEEDKHLSEVVLDFVRSGKKQLDAFAQVAFQLERTPAAVGFRWNRYLRHEHKSELENAKMSFKTSKPPKIRLRKENILADARMFLSPTEFKIFFLLLQKIAQEKGSEEA